MSDRVFHSKRESRSGEIRLPGVVESIFPLFGPVREREWAPGWDPVIVYSQSPWIEESMVFTTRGHDPLEDIIVWTVSRYDPGQARVEYTVFTPDRLWTIDIRCREDEVPSWTRVEVTYTYTGLTLKGNETIDRALQTIFHLDLRDWEDQLLRYLTGAAGDVGGPRPSPHL